MLPHSLLHPMLSARLCVAVQDGGLEPELNFESRLARTLIAGVSNWIEGDFFASSSAAAMRRLTSASTSSGVFPVASILKSAATSSRGRTRSPQSDG